MIRDYAVCGFCGVRMDFLPGLLMASSSIGEGLFRRTMPVWSTARRTIIPPSRMTPTEIFLPVIGEYRSLFLAPLSFRLSCRMFFRLLRAKPRSRRHLPERPNLLLLRRAGFRRLCWGSDRSSRHGSGIAAYVAFRLSGAAFRFLPRCRWR